MRWMCVLCVGSALDLRSTPPPPYTQIDSDLQDRLFAHVRMGAADNLAGQVALRLVAAHLRAVGQDFAGALCRLDRPLMGILEMNCPLCNTTSCECPPLTLPPSALSASILATQGEQLSHSKAWVVMLQLDKVHLLSCVCSNVTSPTRPRAPPSQWPGPRGLTAIVQVCEAMRVSSHRQSLLASMPLGRNRTTLENLYIERARGDEQRFIGAYMYIRYSHYMSGFSVSLSLYSYPSPPPPPYSSVQADARVAAKTRVRDAVQGTGTAPCAYLGPCERVDEDDPDAPSLQLISGPRLSLQAPP
jgi:hypothetical protein